MLRGINVGGRKIVKMEKLLGSFEELGFGRVRTYVNSGNVVFEISKIPSSVLSRRIEERISQDSGFPITIFLRTADDLRRILRDNPFLKERGIDQSKLLVTFLSVTPQKAALEKLDSLDGGSHRFRINGEEIYLYCPDGYGRTKLSNNAFERFLAVAATTRNWKTVNDLFAMSSNLESSTSLVSS
jgi:uncharacterized protein (DUF1697 family)